MVKKIFHNVEKESREFLKGRLCTSLMAFRTDITVLVKYIAH